MSADGKSDSELEENWRKKNKQAIKSSNDYVEQNGLPINNSAFRSCEAVVRKS